MVSIIEDNIEVFNILKDIENLIDFYKKILIEKKIYEVNFLFSSINSEREENLQSKFSIFFDNFSVVFLFFPISLYINFLQKKKYKMNLSKIFNISAVARGIFKTLIFYMFSQKKKINKK